MPANPRYGQRDYMRKLVVELGAKRDVVCAAYAQAERDGIVPRRSNASKHSPDEYAIRLWLDGTGKKGWLNANRT